MDYLVKNWALFVALLAAMVVMAAYVMQFKNWTKEKQVAKVKEWLLYAVTMAEKELGGGTGRLKLRYVYDLFLTKFSWLASIISFEQFSAMVDEALEEMRAMLENNKEVQAIVQKE